MASSNNDRMSWGGGSSVGEEEREVVMGGVK
jgi:hypothetical protein